MHLDVKEKVKVQSQEGNNITVDDEGVFWDLLPNELPYFKRYVDMKTYECHIEDHIPKDPNFQQILRNWVFCDILAVIETLTPADPGKDLE